MAPPLRGKRDVEALLEALADGTIDCIATDHAPHALSEKEDEFEEAANGVVGLETAVPLLLDRLVRPGVIDLATLVTRLSSGPARLLNLPGGSLAPGAPADITVLDLERAVDGGAGARSARGPQHAVRRRHGTRRAVDDHRRRRAGDAMTPALLALADGRVFRGPGLRRRRRGDGRGRLQHVDDGLPGDPHRSVVPRADRLHDLSAHRQLRDQSGRRRVAPALGQRLHREGGLRATRRTGAAGCALDDYLREHGIVGIQGIDTRALTRHLRDHGAQEGIISTVEPDARPPRRSGRARCPACSAATSSAR